ncbi:phospholipase/carboxylesterase [Alicyclobacillus sacchari]|uniref:Phospholipase/carboxylesterase n=1 Tax=Alicyclobacillus sacchari TaxID=392010 RepID=A0A4R8LMM0_9BACL|nr:alpha/beta hydrolase [Alicyclobacillus sacchari]TDY44569.1 phospholipase/carboxylesterase [Alicyclobacillus sacchari]GMA57915.1 phospholipase/carboxylesterase [Alicyclobacillus sacchari]
MTFIHKLIPSATGTNEITLLLLHGTGGNEEDLFPLGQFLAPHAAMLGVRGKVLENGMPRFFRRLAEGVFDEEDLIFRTHELAQFVEEAANTYALNPERIYAVGYSNGANIAASMLFLKPGILSGAILFRAMVPLEPSKLPDLTGKRVLMQSGKHDPIVPASNSEKLAQLLKQAGAEVTLNWQNTGHGLTNSELTVAQKWMAQLQN